LQGIVDPKLDLAKQQSDLFVLMTKLLISISQTQDTETLRNITEILEIEKDTWEMLVRREVSDSYSLGTQSDQGTHTSFDFSA
jgi:flagellin-specific chaperone FliS